MSLLCVYIMNDIRSLLTVQFIQVEQIRLPLPRH